MTNGVAMVYRTENKEYCPNSKDDLHCAHWEDCEPCCRCGDHPPCKADEDGYCESCELPLDAEGHPIKS